MGLPYVDECKHRVKLIKVSDNPNKLRDTEIEGISPRLPKVGDFFEMLSEPKTLPPPIYEDMLVAGLRYINTSEIMNILEETEKSILFRTRNSTYRVEIL